MYCPQCSQQQISDEMRFCSRCGFQLDGVRELMAGGAVTIISKEEKLESRRAIALKGARRGVMIMLASLPLFAIFGVMTAEDDDFAVLFILPVLLLLIGFVRTLYGIFCQKRAKKVELETAEPRVLNTQKFRAIENSTPIDFLPSRQTAEVRQPASVTENTTRLLDDDVNSSRAN